MLIMYTILILMLMLIAIFDISTRRIPNWGVGIICLLGLSFNYFFVEGLGLNRSLSGLLIGLLLMLPGYVCASMGAGDVKFMAAIGSVLGVEAILDVALYSYLAMLIMAVLFICIKGDLFKMLHRMYLMLAVKMGTGQLIYYKPEASEAASYHMPLAPAITAGTLYYIFPKVCATKTMVALCHF